MDRTDNRRSPGGALAHSPPSFMAWLYTRPLYSPPSSLDQRSVSRVSALDTGWSNYGVWRVGSTEQWESSESTCRPAEIKAKWIHGPYAYHCEQRVFSWTGTKPQQAIRRPPGIRSLYGIIIRYLYSYSGVGTTASHVWSGSTT